MSPRAAWRLESLGFTEVYDYAAGKLDWLAAGLATEGTLSRRPRAGTLARPDVPTCGLGDRVGDVCARFDEAAWDVCVVVNERGVVMGVLRAKELSADPACTAEEAMLSGPSTFRPHVSAEEMASYMSDHDRASALITRSDGTLVGLLTREDAAAAAEPR